MEGFQLMYNLTHMKLHFQHILEFPFFFLNKICQFIHGWDLEFIYGDEISYQLS